MYIDCSKRNSKSVKFTTESEFAYCNELEDCTPLKKEEIRNLITEIKKKKKSTFEASKEKLVKVNLRFVVRVANYYFDKLEDFELSDLIQEGNIGLIQAVEDVVTGKYVNKKKHNFLSYAVWKIRGRITDFITKSIKYQHVSYDSFYDIWQESNIDIHSSDINKFREGVSTNEMELLDEVEENKFIVKRMLKLGTQRQELILSEYYGISRIDDPIKISSSFKEIGEKLDLSSQRCRFIHNKALERIRITLASNLNLLV